MKHWLISALGAGWGHVNRAIALGRQLARQDTVHILTNSPYARWIQSQIPGVESPEIAAQLYLHILEEASIEQVKGAVGAIALNQAWTGIIVDTFPRGLVGEWVDLWPKVSQRYPRCHRILVQRDLNPHYLRAKQVPGFIRQHYHHIFCPGEGMTVMEEAFPSDSCLVGSVHPKVIHRFTFPWLMRDAVELPAKPAGRLRFSILEGALIVICAAGNPAELELFGLLTNQLVDSFPTVQVRCLAFQCPPHCPPNVWIRHWPGMELLQLADVVIGGGGYNTVHECAALDIPLVAFSFERRYDRQRRRTQQFGYGVKTVEEAIATTQKLLAVPRSSKQSDRGRFRYTNGVSQAVQYLHQLSVG